MAKQIILRLKLKAQSLKWRVGKLDSSRWKLLLCGRLCKRKRPPVIVDVHTPSGLLTLVRVSDTWQVSELSDSIWALLARVMISISSFQFSRSVVSNSLRPHELQRARPPCPSPTPGVHSDSRPSSQWCHPAISCSVIPFSSCPQSLPASESFHSACLKYVLFFLVMPFTKCFEKLFGYWHKHEIWTMLICSSWEFFFHYTEYLNKSWWFYNPEIIFKPGR